MTPEQRARLEEIERNLAQVEGLGMPGGPLESCRFLLQLLRERERAFKEAEDYAKAGHFGAAWHSISAALSAPSATEEDEGE